MRAVRYPPNGVRGMGSGLGRSARWGRLTDYIQTSDENIALVVQVETRTALGNVEAIASTEGVDGVLFGPADLAADLGVPGQRSHPEVVEAIGRGVDAVGRTGKPAGIMLTDVQGAQEWLSRGISFAGVGVDATLLIRAADDLLARFGRGARPEVDAGNPY